MVEINEAQRKKEKELKEMRTTSETFGTMLNAPTFEFMSLKLVGMTALRYTNHHRKL